MFDSIFTLRFRDSYYETKYVEEKYAFRKKYNIILSLILTCISVAVSICFILYIEQLQKYWAAFYMVMICFVTTLINIILTLLCIFIKGNRLQEWLTYINYMLIYFTFILMRLYFSWILKIDILSYALVMVVEVIFRLTWSMLGLVDFVPGSYLQTVNIVFTFALYGPIFPLKYYYSFSIYTVILVLTSSLSYFFIREQKKSFYYNLSLKHKNEWYESIIDNMNSGFLSIKDNEVQYYNKTLFSFMKKPVTETISGSTENVSLNANLDVNDLFDNIIFENNKIDNYERVLEVLNKKYNEIGDNFVFLGTKDIEVTLSSFINLEVFGRCYSSLHNVIDRYEFIFNDISRSKQIEQKNAEFKYKTLFLSKVAHEFKNPLLCISELVDQVNDNLSTNKPIKPETNTSDILKQIKSMSNYLIILVKDMDYFSQKNSEQKMEKRIEVDKVNLSEIIKFCTDIVQALIKKAHKELKVDFNVIKENNLPTHITTDEIKLKQVLINILSNAVKYTYHGFIYLRVSLEEGGSLKFQIDDTGKGITEEQKEKLFTPFANEFDKLNKISSGLGLSIVKELLEILGSKIELDSSLSKGSSFYFTLQLNEDDLNTSNISQTTLLGTHFNELPIYNRLNSSSVITPEAKYNVIVVDDETMIRQATMRLLSKAFKEKNLSINIIEASDGIDCLNIYYNFIKDGKTVSCILCDETMVYMNGSNTAQLIDNISKNKNILHVPFYILSAYENLSLSSAKSAIDNIFTKPLRKQYIDEIIKHLN
jgi:signal transduction histidine kinase/CheY-like chemotaxis protein